MSMSSSYNRIWNDQGSGGSYDVQFWRYHNPGTGFRPLGHVVMPHYNDINSKRGTIVVANNPDNKGEPAFKSPTGYNKIWIDQGSGATQDGGLWEPIPPSGYKAIGHLCWESWSTPPLDAVWCVRNDLAGDGHYGERIWYDKGTGATVDCSVWEVKPAKTSTYGSENIPIFTDCFLSNNRWEQPSITPRVLLLPLENNYQEFDPPTPVLDPNDLPNVGDEFYKIEQCRAKLPYVFFFPADDSRCVDRIDKPFCNLIKIASLTVKDVVENRSNSNQPQEESIEMGISESQSKELEETVSVGMSSTIGVMGKLFGAELSVSLNYQFTSRSSHSYEEYRIHKKTQILNTSPHYANVVCSKRLFIRATRSDETAVVEEVAFHANENGWRIHGLDLPH